VTQAKKVIKVLILKYNRNFERLIEQITLVWRENPVANGGLIEMRNGHVMSVEKTLRKLLEYSRI